MRRRSRSERSGRLSRSAVIMRIWRLISASHWSVAIVSSEVVPVLAVVPALARDTGRGARGAGREGSGFGMGSASVRQGSSPCRAWMYYRTYVLVLSRGKRAVNGEWVMEGRVSRMIVTLEFSCCFYAMAIIHAIMTYNIGHMTYNIGQLPCDS